jgi:hypothetical protein
MSANHKGAVKKWMPLRGLSAVPGLPGGGVGHRGGVGPAAPLPDGAPGPPGRPGQRPTAGGRADLSPRDPIAGQAFPSVPNDYDQTNSLFRDSSTASAEGGGWPIPRSSPRLPVANFLSPANQFRTVRVASSRPRAAM